MIETCYSNPINDHESMWLFQIQKLLKKHGGIDLGATKGIHSWIFYLAYNEQINLIKFTFRELKQMSYNTMINKMFEAAGSEIRMEVRNGGRPADI